MNSTDMRRLHSPAAGLEDIVGRWVYLAHWLTPLQAYYFIAQPRGAN